MPLLDAVKGLACVVIVGHHFARYGPLPAGASSLAPALFEWLAQDGRLAVQVFLVLAGFLAAGSLAPDGVPRIDRPLARVFQRYARLAMPYLAALSFSVLVAALVRPWLDGELVPAAPGMAQLLAHGLLLQDLLDYEALSTGVWYVAIDFQLFVLALAAIGFSELLQRRCSMRPERSRWLAVALVLLLALASLAVFNRHAAFDDTAFYFFGAYGLGMLVFWIGRATRRSTWQFGMALLLLVGAAALAIDWRSRIAIALLTALMVAIVQRRAARGAADWPTVARPLLRLGRISYSLFLIHFPVLLLMSAALGRLAPAAPWIGMLGLAVAFVLSIAAAMLLYRWVESKPATWSAVLALFAGLLVCGALASG
ncbi:acyltransferase [Variovorax paradoxus]|nr:acyltransferase [Variovorax paradoxus]